MADAWLWGAWLLGTYLLGGLPFGYLIGRLRGVDVRTVGSRNIGATNVFRTVGKPWGLLALCLDMLKGLLPVLAARGGWLPLPAAHGELLPLAVGVTAVAGHMLTPYMGFRGGKGVATACGMLLGLLPALVGIAFAVFAIAFALTNYISLGSCLASVTLAVLVWLPILGNPGCAALPQCVLVTVLMALIVWKHRSNLVRLRNGTENKIRLLGKNSVSQAKEEKR